MITHPEAVARRGEATKERMILPIPQKFNPSMPVETSTAPITPPTKACEELLGSATHQVRMFQITAPASAAMRTCSFTWLADCTMSAPMVLATPVLYMAPRKLSTAAIKIASFGEMARVETDVAMAFAVSWKPLIKSNTSASTITVNIKK